MALLQSRKSQLLFMPSTRQLHFHAEPKSHHRLLVLLSLLGPGLPLLGTATWYAVLLPLARGSSTASG
jgi:hypothetical protein